MPEMRYLKDENKKTIGSAGLQFCVHFGNYGTGKKEDLLGHYHTNKHQVPEIFLNLILTAYRLFFSFSFF